MQPAFKRKWKLNLILLCASLGLFLISTVISGTSSFRYINWTIAGTIALMTLGAALLIVVLLLSQRFSFQGKRYPAVALSSVFCALLLGGGVMAFREIVPLAGFGSEGEIQMLLLAVSTMAAALLAVDLYVFSHIAPRYNGYTCGIIGLVLAALASLLTLAVIVWLAVNLFSQTTDTYAVVNWIGLLLGCASAALLLMAAALGMMPARNARRTPHAASEPMLPLLESYRAAIGKERA